MKTNRWQTTADTKDISKDFTKGQEIGEFNLGSTIVLIYEVTLHAFKRALTFVSGTTTLQFQCQRKRELEIGRRFDCEDEEASLDAELDESAIQATDETV